MKFLERWFSKNPSKLFLEFFPKDSYWKVVSWNLDLKDSLKRKWTLETRGKEKSNQFDWLKGHHQTLSIFENGKLKASTHSKDGDGLKELMNLALHSTLKVALEDHHPFLLSPVSGATSLDYQNEAKALAWIQATAGTLTRALGHLEKRPDLILTAAVFSGTESGSEVLRVMAFNLDFFLYMRSDSTMEVIVFDDKGEGHGAAQSPSFQQIIKVTKPQIYDEIVKLVHRIATVGEIR